MRARICLKALLVIALSVDCVSGQTATRRQASPAQLQVSMEIATTTDDGRPSSLRVAVKNVGNVTVWMPVLGQECTYVHVKWGGLLEVSACGISGIQSQNAERIVRDWVQLRPGEFMSSTVAVRSPTDGRGKEYWVVYEPPQATKEEVNELLQSGYAIPTEKVETEHQSYANR